VCVPQGEFVHGYCDSHLVGMSPHLLRTINTTQELTCNVASNVRVGQNSRNREVHCRQQCGQRWT
jgi:hypothetical protein